MTKPQTTNPPAVLITGTSTGIGAACALDLDNRGWRVFAAVRKEADAQRLREKATGPLQTVMLDVTQPESIAAAAETIGQAVGAQGLAGLVNNAGIVVPGPLELLSTDDMRRQFEVNVFGHLAVTRAMLPLLRKVPGRIVNLGSIAGRIAPPYMGAYGASKHALEAVTDVLRVELAIWGIHVAIIEPDTVDTPIWDKMSSDNEQLAGQLSPEVLQLYEQELQQLRKATYRMDKSGMPVEKVVRAVRHALSARRPKTRYPVGWRTRFGFWGIARVPDRVRDWFMLRMMGVRR